MAKRRSENGQMRREEYEAQDARDGDGVTADSFSVGFERAPEASIRQRKIVKARVGPRAPKPASQPASGAAANPFGGFSGLTAGGSASPFAPAAPAPSPAAAAAAPAAPASSYQEAMEVLNKEFMTFVNSQARESPSASWIAAAKVRIRRTRPQLPETAR